MKQFDLICEKGEARETVNENYTLLTLCRSGFIKLICIVISTSLH